MKYLRANARIALAGLCSIVFVGGIGVFRAKADAWDKKTVLTIHEPIQVRDRLLEPGTYVFKLLDSNSDRHVVQIFNEDQSHIIDTVLAIPNYRLEPTGKSRFGFWETPPGYAKAMRAWFYPGDNFGQEFPYPKHLAMVETAMRLTPVPPAPEPAPAPQPPPPTAQAEPTPTPQPAPPQEIAKNETPEPAPEPAPQAPAAAPEPAPQTPAPAPADNLPKTASSYPLAGLIGLGCLGLFGLVRGNAFKRQS
jgi:hypothetical protein